MSEMDFHGKPCYYCGKPIDNLAGNPGKWSVLLCHEDDPGVVKPHHSQCVMDRLLKYEQYKKDLQYIADYSSEDAVLFLDGFGDYKVSDYAKGSLDEE
jgi:hypothetical protein